MARIKSRTSASTNPSSWTSMLPGPPLPQNDPPKYIERRVPLLAAGERYPSKSSPNRIPEASTQCLVNIYRGRQNYHFVQHVKRPAETKSLRAGKRRMLKEGRKMDMHSEQLRIEEMAIKNSYAPRPAAVPLSGNLPSQGPVRHAPWIERAILPGRKLERLRKFRPGSWRAIVLKLEGRIFPKNIPHSEKTRAQRHLIEKREMLVATLLDKETQVKGRMGRLHALCYAEGTGPQCAKQVAKFQKKQQEEWKKQMKEVAAQQQFGAEMEMQEMVRKRKALEEQTEGIGQTRESVARPRLTFPEDQSWICYMDYDSDDESS
ncbi:hypothetical protein BDV96DRAFT_645531 [Lophiotrema nucula]|uniref:Uncharacterized protein n=1 Tax=Lophiotrema nucula TaxID=690887 RepID=A0A6A5ZAT1_9PLEO|nr:hypothetical protein BDV96DRAFT_645531 [Lophiotrema nucula]